VTKIGLIKKYLKNEGFISIYDVKWDVLKLEGEKLIRVCFTDPSNKELTAFIDPLNLFDLLPINEE